MAVDMSVMDTLRDHIGGRQALVMCGRRDDGDEWEQALPRSIAIVTGTTAIPHQDPLDDRDPTRTAVVLPIDPIAPAGADSRQILGERQRVWRLFEDKTIIDCLWDAIGVARPPSIVGDHTLDLASAGAAVNRGDGIVCATQGPGGTPGANGHGIRWWTDQPPRLALTPGTRVKVTPLLAGRALRLHGLVAAGAVVPFPPMDLVTLPRLDRHEFLCCGAVPGPAEPWTWDLTRRLGAGIRDILGYRGVFSVDGIVVDGQFLPTDLNTRLTSAIESTPSHLRVRFQAANICAREGIPIEPAEIDHLSAEAFDTDETTIYGASSTIGSQRYSSPIFQGPAGLTELPGTHTARIGSMMIARSPRGWTVRARLAAGHDPRLLAVDIWRLSDRVFGTDFGDLGQPFDRSAAGNRRTQPSQ